MCTKILKNAAPIGVTQTTAKRSTRNDLPVAAAVTTARAITRALATTAAATARLRALAHAQAVPFQVRPRAVVLVHQARITAAAVIPHRVSCKVVDKTGMRPDELTHDETPSTLLPSVRVGFRRSLDVKLVFIGVAGATVISGCACPPTEHTNRDVFESRTQCEQEWRDAKACEWIEERDSPVFGQEVFLGPRYDAIGLPALGYSPTRRTYSAAIGVFIEVKRRGFGATAWCHSRSSNSG